MEFGVGYFHIFVSDLFLGHFCTLFANFGNQNFRFFKFCRFGRTADTVI